MTTVNNIAEFQFVYINLIHFRWANPKIDMPISEAKDQSTYNKHIVNRFVYVYRS